MRDARGRYIPDNALPVINDPLGMAYVYPFVGRSGVESGRRYGVIAYSGNRTKNDFHFTFRKDAEVDACLEKWLKGLQEHKARVAASRADRFKPHTLKVNDIITNSWGYDQTNVDWYRVTRTTAHYVWLKPISGHTTQAEGYSSMAGLSSPHIDTSNPDPSTWGVVDGEGKETKHAATGDSCTMRHGCGSKWDGKAKYESWYA